MRSDSRVARLSASVARLPRGARVALVILAVIAAGAVFAPWITRYDPIDIPDMVGLKSAPPSASHIFGTDPRSHDVFSRVLYGARVSLSVAALSVVLSATIGTLYGVVAGYAGGWIETVMMRVIDALLSIPRILMLIAVLAIWDSVRVPGLILLIGLTGWFEVSRIVRGQALAIRNREFVIAARSLGARPASIIRRHILPNVISPVVVASTLAVGNVILLEAALSYLNLGVRVPAPSWGSMMQEAAVEFPSYWWAVVFPGVAIVATVLAVNTLGDALRDVLDPRQLPGNPSGESPGPRNG